MSLRLTTLSQGLSCLNRRTESSGSRDDYSCGQKNSRRGAELAAPAPPPPAAPAPPAPIAPVAPPAPPAPAAPRAAAAPGPLAPVVPPAPPVPVAAVAPPPPPAPAAPPALTAAAFLVRAPSGPAAPAPPVPPALAPPAPAVPPAAPVPAAPVAPPAPPTPAAPPVPAAPAHPAPAIRPVPPLPGAPVAPPARTAPPAPVAPAPSVRAPRGPAPPAPLVPPAHAPPAPAAPPAPPSPAVPPGLVGPAPPAPVAPLGLVAPAPPAPAAPPLVPPVPPAPAVPTGLAAPAPAGPYPPPPGLPRRTIHARIACGESVSSRSGCGSFPALGPPAGSPTAPPPLGLAVPPEPLGPAPLPLGPVRDHFLALDLLEQHLLAVETSVVVVGAARGTTRTPFFEGWSPSPLAPSYASAGAAADVSVAEDVGAASASAKRRNSKGNGGKGGGGGSGGGGGGSGSSGGGSSGGGGGGGTGGGSGGSGGGGGGSGGSGGRGSRGGSGTGGGGTGARRVGSGGGQCKQYQRRIETQLPQQLRLAHLHVASWRPCTPSRRVAASVQVSTSGQVAASCSCRLLSHQTLLWHHHLGHPFLPHLRGMHSRLLVFGLPRSLPPLPPSPAPPCLPCIKGRQHAAPHSSSFPPTTAPLQTLHMDVKGQVIDVMIPWIRTVRLQLRERFGQDLPVLRLHSDRGGEFSSNLLWEFCCGEGILQSFMLSDSPQQNGIAERRIGLVMEVARTSMIHAAAPNFLWPFAVRYAAHQLNLWPRVSLPETLPTLRWTGEVGDASVFRGPGPSGVSQVDPLPGPAPVQVAVGSGAARGAASGGAEPGGAESEGAGSGGAEPGGEEPVGVEPVGVEPEGAEPGGAESKGAESGGAEPRGATWSGDPTGASSRLSPQQLREWFVRRPRLQSGATRAGDARVGGAGVTAGAGGIGGTADTGPGGARTRGTGATGTGGTGAGGAGAGGAGAAGAGAADPGAGGARDTVRPRPYFVPLLQQPTSPLHAPSPYTEQSGVLTKRREPSSRPVSRVCTARHVPRSRPPPVPGTHAMALRPSFVPLRVPLPAPPESSLPDVPDPKTDRARAASPTVSRLLATANIDPSFESAAASALVAQLLDFAAACHLDYATALLAESASASPLSVGGECALGTDILEDRQEDFECLATAVPRFVSMLLALEGDPDALDIPTPRSYAEAITCPYSSQWQAAMDAEMASQKSTGTYVDDVPPPGANIVDGLWIFRVKRPPGSPPTFKARYVARGFSQRQGVDYFENFSPSPKMTTLWAPREWHDTLRTTLAALGFAPSNADPSLFLRTDTSLPPFYVLVYVDNLIFATADTEAVTLVLQRFGFQFSSPQPTPLSTSHSLSAPPSDESVEPSGPYPELVGCLMYLMTCTRPDLAYPLSLQARYVAPGRNRKVHWDAAKRVLRYLYSTSGMGLVLGGRGPVVLTGHAYAFWVDDSATQRSSQGYTLSLGSGCVSWRSTHSSSILSSSCEAEIYAGAMAAQELRWLTYLPSDLGEQPRLPPVLYVDNKAMIALCREHRLEH
ncbi:unnamed protein product [Closterium sp. NIES-54]